MSRWKNVENKFKRLDKTITYDEAVVLLEHYGYVQDNKGKTSGSRVRFTSAFHKYILLHKPHPQKELIKDFHTAVDDYLDLCKVQGKKPEKAFKGTFNIRISPELHRDAAIYAFEHNVSLNSVVENALSLKLQMM